MNPDVFAAHLRALRAECEALLALLEPGPPEPPSAAENEPPACDHPDYQRIPTSAYQGAPSFYCRSCRQEIVGA